MTPQEKPDLNSLPEFWRALVFGKKAFRDENDYYASIRVLSRIQSTISELLKPYIKASIIATREPGAMCEFDRQMAGFLGQMSMDEAENQPLLDQEFRSAPPLEGDQDFLPLVREMRGWNGDSGILRALLLLAHLNRIGGHDALKQWLERPNVILGGRSPLNAIVQGKWIDVADLADEMLAGKPKAKIASEPGESTL
jgi:hypothetical protein